LFTGLQGATEYTIRVEAVKVINDTIVVIAETTVQDTTVNQ
jgi:hypothetical protein